MDLPGARHTQAALHDHGLLCHARRRGERHGRPLPAVIKGHGFGGGEAQVSGGREGAVVGLLRMYALVVRLGGAAVAAHERGALDRVEQSRRYVGIEGVFGVVLNAAAAEDGAFEAALVLGRAFASFEVLVDEGHLVVLLVVGHASLEVGDLEHY